ncbi:hypothetical protein H4R35_002596 [Dimargaris xerosporica]|nr:hypothetical protein H4R35_002596 [Dimargaris xerosporica]
MRLSTTFIAIGLLALMGTVYARPAEVDNEDAGSIDTLQEDSSGDADSAPMERRSYYRSHYNGYGRHYRGYGHHGHYGGFSPIIPGALTPATGIPIGSGGGILG